MRDEPFARRAWTWVRARVSVLDPALLVIMSALIALGLLTLYSASSESNTRFADQLRNLAAATGVMFLVASIPPAVMMRLAVPVYVIGVILLIAVDRFGVIAKGAQRWLDLGFTRVQPSEVMKLAVPMMLAWYFHRRADAIRTLDFAVAAVLLLAPVALIAKQPDLGTAILVFGAGFFVIFFAGLPWKWLAAMFATGLALLPVAWHFMHDYQRNRIMTLIDPTQDPLGKGFHTIQSMIAIGSGGLFGKGWLEGTQTHLEFIPERTTDFIFAVFSEEFGLLGNLILVVLFFALITRALVIAANAATMYTRLMAAAIALIIFTYVFVNMGMVSGILPVVGVPLPFISYGGTALVTLGMACGMLMSISRNRQLVQS